VWLCVTLALWLSAADLTLADRAGEPRLGLFASPLWLAPIGAFVLAAIRLAAPGRRASILWLSAVLLLPWLPVPVPPSFMMWAGPLRYVIWTIVAVALAGPALATLAGRAGPLLGNSRGAPVVAAALAAVVYLAAARQIAPRLPVGDEPHYLVITQSLLLDRDLKIENNHRRGDYLPYFPNPLRPDYLRRGVDGEIYSIHAPGLSVIIAPAFAAFGYPGVIAFLALASAAATGLVWRLTWLICHSAAASWFAWASIALSVPVFYLAFAIFPDGPAGILVLVAFSALVVDQPASRWRLVAAGTAIALLPWLHTRLAVAAVVLGALIALRNLRRGGLAARLVALAAVPLASAGGWLWFFYAVYGTPDPRAPYGGATQSALAKLPAGLTGLLADEQFGLLPNAPVYVLALVGLAPLFRRRPRTAIELALVAGAYTATVGVFHVWWGGASSPARLLVPILPLMALPLAACYGALRRRATRLFALGALVVSLLVTAALSAVDQGALLYNVRDGASLLLLWASPLADLTTALPSFFQNPYPAVAVHAAVWVVAAAAALATGLFVETRSASTTTIGLSMAVAGGLAAMAAATTVWHFNGSRGLTPLPASLLLLDRFRPGSGQLLVRYEPFERLPLGAAPEAVSLDPPGRARARTKPYGPASVTLLSGRAYLEDPGAWIAGGQEAALLLVPQPGGRVRLVLRNAPVENRVVVATGSWRDELELAPREERVIDLPRRRAVLRVSTSTGARPVEFEPGSEDRRLLGCWIEFR
jgi:hypothetical protein